MKWKIVSLFMFVFSLSFVFSQPELAQNDLEKMVREAEIILEGKCKNIQPDIYKISISEIFQGMQRVNTLNLSLSSDYARVHLFSMEIKYQEILNRGKYQELVSEFAKNGQILETANEDKTFVDETVDEEGKRVKKEIRKKIASKVIMKTKKAGKLWSIDNTITIQTCDPSVAKPEWKTDSMVKEYIVEKEGQFLHVYSPLKEETHYIFFIQKKEENFVLCPFLKNIMKSDLFLSSRVREQALRWRGERSDIVVLANIESTKEEGEGKEVIGTAHCKLIRIYKGSITDSFVVKYVRYKQPFPPSVILFDHLNYVLFLKKGNEIDGSYPLINPYEGAYSEQRYLLRDLEACVKNQFDEIAGKPVQGLKSFARASKTEIKKEEPVKIELMLINEGETDLEIYYHQSPYFTVFHILDAQGRVVVAKYPRVMSIPPVQKKYFILLPSGYPIVIPDFNLQEYCQFKPGKYSIYVEFNLPWEYSGKTIGKAAWSGKVLSNKIEITITD